MWSVTYKNEVFLAQRSRPACCVAWRADLARQPGSKHASATGTTGTSGCSFLFEPRLLVPDFQDEATSRDNGILEITTKTSPSAAENRCIGTAIATILPAKLSAAQNGAIHHPLSPPPSYLAGGPWQLTGPTRRQSSFFHHSAPHLNFYCPVAFYHTPFALATNGDMWGGGGSGSEGRTGAPRLSVPYNTAQRLAPPALRG